METGFFFNLEICPRSQKTLQGPRLKLEVCTRICHFFLSFQIITVISTLIVFVIFLIWWKYQKWIFGSDLGSVFILLITTMMVILIIVFFISLDWYYWCTVKKVYNNTKNNQDIILLTEIEHEGIERHSSV